ncbi:hypothetical protein ACRN9A_07745 [Shewanella frigidimarina]|uniref:hypothetical protein n=1 Tax=Shewanella frigidimarina TaxID=56812 RepID=UPI003D7A7446
MLKSIFVATLFFNLLATASAVANPLALFVEQCLQYQPDLGQDKLVSFQSVEQQAVEFEKRTLALNNINDRIQYYRPFANDSLNRQGLLWCQLHLADELYALATAANTQRLIDQLLQLRPPYDQLGQRLVAIRESQWELIQKSKLHSAQASNNQALSQQQFTMQFNQPDCALTNELNADSNNTNIEIRIAKYLLKQPNEHCRKQAWLAYQIRAKDKQASALALIHRLQQQHAIAQDYDNSAQAQLSLHDLTPQLLTQFLASQTINLDIAPWNIANALSRVSNSSTIKPIATDAFLQKIFESLKALDLKFEFITVGDARVDHSKIDKTTSPSDSQQNSLSDTQLIRVWHQQRLMGEIFTYTQDEQHNPLNVDSQLIKQTVIGHQFGQYSLNFPSQLTNVKQQQKLINAISRAIVSLAQGRQFYFLTNRAQNTEAHAIATQWLAYYLEQQLNLPKLSKRHQLVAQYQQQLWVFRAKVSLAFYQYKGDFKGAQQEVWLSHNQSLSTAFEQSFGLPWPNATDAIFSYQAIANQSINHYLPLWQTALAQLIIAETPAQISPNEIFDLLVVNETHLTLNDQLERLIGLPIDPHSLIRRFKHAGTTQE